jgi:hypothetical protein
VDDKIMDLDLDPARVLYVVGVLFGIAAVLYFARDIVFELSITVRALLLLFAFVALLVTALATSESPVVPVAAVLSAATYLAFLSYTLSRFDVGSDGTFFALLVSAVLFLLLGYLVRERDLTPSRRAAQYVVVAVALLAVVVVGADVAASDVEYDLETVDEATVDGGGEIAIGTLTIENQFVFREPVDTPNAFACIYVPGMEEHEMRPEPVRYQVNGDRIPDSIGGASTITAAISVGMSDEEAATIEGPMPIERADECPDPTGEPRIVFVVGEDVPHPPPR